MDDRKWVDFTQKINYLYKVLYNNKKVELAMAFSDGDELSSSADLNSKLKTINNWLVGNVSKPNKFSYRYYEYKISRLKCSSGELLLPLNAFSEWEFEKFKSRIDSYLEDRKNRELLPTDMIKYLYVYNTSMGRVIKYDIKFYNEIDNSKKMVSFSSDDIQDVMHYKGHLEVYHSMYFIELRNSFDYTYYVFENIADIFRGDLEVLGIGLTKDSNTRKPKAYMALLTSKELSDEEIEIAKNVLNLSNTLLADFDYKSFKEEPKITNMYKKIVNLYKDVNTTKDVTIDSAKLDSLYKKLLFESFSSLKNIVKKVYEHDNYYIHFTKERAKYIFSTLAKSGEDIDIACAIYKSGLTNLDRVVSLISGYKEQLKGGCKIRLYVVLKDESAKLLKYVSAIDELKSNRVEVSYAQYEDFEYALIIKPKSSDLGFFQYYTDIDENILNIAVKQRAIGKLSDVLSILEKKKNNAISKSTIFVGDWYLYTSQDDSNYYEIEITFKGNKITGAFVSGSSEGVIEEYRSFYLLIFDDSVIKIDKNLIRNQELQIIQVSILSRQVFTFNAVALFGVLTNKRLENKEQYAKYLDAIYNKELSTSKKLVASNLEFNRVLIGDGK